MEEEEGEEVSSLQEQARYRRFCVSMKSQRPREITKSLEDLVALEDYLGSVPIEEGERIKEDKAWDDRGIRSAF